MSYDDVKRLMDRNPKISKRKVMEAVGCGDLQASAWMQRWHAEQSFKDQDGPFGGKYKGSTPVPKPAPQKKQPVQQKRPRKGRPI